MVRSVDVVIGVVSGMWSVGVVSRCNEWMWSLGWSVGVVSWCGQWMLSLGWSVDVVNEGVVS